MARKQPVVITDASENPETELRRREIRYVAMMLFRAACLIGAAAAVMRKPPVWQLWSVLLVLAAIVLPWLAVLLANDRPPRKQVPQGPSGQPAVEQREHKVIDPD